MAGATVTLWGLAHYLGALVAYSLIYGFFAFGFAEIRPIMSMVVSKSPSASVAIVSILVANQGVANMQSGPVGACLLLVDDETGSYGVLRYKWVSIFAGSSPTIMIFSTLNVCFIYLWPRKLVCR